MCTKLTHLVSIALALGLAASPVLGKVLLEDDFEAETMDLGKWQLVNGPDVAIVQTGGQVFFDRPVTQLNYLATVEQHDPAAVPLTIAGSVTLATDGDMDVWTRATLVGNTGGGPGHVLDSGIRINFWQNAVDEGWPPHLDILEKTAGIWPWDSSISDGANIPGDDEAIDWDFVITDDGTTITATFTQTSDPGNTLTLTGESATDFDTDYVAITVTNGFLNEVCIAGPTTVPFSLTAAGDIELGNDPQVGPDGNSNGSGLGARDIPDRRRVALISYDISELKGRGPVYDVSLSHFSHDQHGEVNVYGIIEDLDVLDVESLTWNTAPGVKNDPAPELNAPVALDMNDLTDVLLTFAGPGEKGVRFSTGASQALADFINSDTDGIVTLLIAASAEDTQLIVRSREHSAGGTFLQGDVAPIATIIWVADNLRYNFDTNETADIGFVSLLRAQGYYVDYKGEYMPHEPGNDEAPLNPEWQYWRELDPDKIAELEAADLIIVARDVASSKYDDTGEAEAWNAISTPLIMQGPHLARTLPKWGWFNSGSTSNKTPRLMTVTAPYHPIFAGIELDPNGAVALVDPNTKVTLIKDPNIGAGNGRVLGLHDEGLTWIAEWDKGVEFYEGSTAFAGGPRMWFGSAVGTSDEALGYVEGACNLTADGEIIFLNAVAYMLAQPPIVENGSFELPGTDKFKAWDGEKDGEGGEPATDIPGWSSDSTPVDSGVETGWGATDGEWTAFLKGADPSVWQLTDLVMGADDVIELKVDAKNNWAATALQLSMYIDFEGIRVPVATAEFALTDAMQEFTLTFAVQDDPLAAGMRLGIELANVSAEGESWIGLDNVRVEVK